MIVVDATFIALVALILFVGGLVLLKIPKAVGAVLDQQSAAIAKELEDAKRLHAEAAALLADYTAKKAAAEAHAQEMLVGAREQAAAITAQTKAQMAEDLKRRERDAEDKIARAEAQALADVRAAAAEAAVAAAEKLLRAQLTPAKQAELVDKGAAELAKKFA